MTSRSTLKREGDGKLFTVNFLSHWSEVVSEDGESFHVKWLGGDGEYVSTEGVKFQEIKP
jgi:hypothetical protein